MNAEAITTPLCTHIKTNGRPCQSPSLTGEPLCFFHNKLRVTHRRPPTVEPLSSFWQETHIRMEGDPEGDPGAIARAYPRQNEIEFPPLEDAESVQLATSMLFQAIATGQIYFKRARLLLYTLKIATINQRALAQSRAADAAAPHPALSFRSAAEESASLSHAPVNSPTAAPPYPPPPETPVAVAAALDVAQETPIGVAAGSQPEALASGLKLERGPSDQRGLSLGPSLYPATNPHAINSLAITP
jgi:hypothetical protein